MVDRKAPLAAGPYALENNPCTVGATNARLQAWLLSERQERRAYAPSGAAAIAERAVPVPADVRGLPWKEIRRRAWAAHLRD